MARVFLSHSSSDSREAVALKRWLVDAEPGLANEIFLDLDRNTGIRTGCAVEGSAQAGQRTVRGRDLPDHRELGRVARVPCGVPHGRADEQADLCRAPLQPLAGRDITTRMAALRHVRRRAEDSDRTRPGPATRRVPDRRLAPALRRAPRRRAGGRHVCLAAGRRPGPLTVPGVGSPRNRRRGGLLRS